MFLEDSSGELVWQVYGKPVDKVLSGGLMRLWGSLHTWPATNKGDLFWEHFFFLQTILLYINEHLIWCNFFVHYILI